MVLAVDMGLMAGMTASAMANNVFHCAGVRGSSVGRGGSGVAFGDTGVVVSDMLAVVVVLSGPGDVDPHICSVLTL
jgi:acetyl-CoA carboxylase carboxyltransferase component